VRTHFAKNKGEVSGSGKKPHKQKGLGIARAGNKRAPGRAKGGKAFGPRTKDFSFALSKKVRLLGMLFASLIAIPSS